MTKVPVFDLDGTLLDSDRALIDPFVRLGVDESDIVFGQTLIEACSRLGVDVDEYLDAYDVDRATPYPGVDELIARLNRWAVFSNKSAVCALPELGRLGWEPEVGLFYESFLGPKRLDLVLNRLGLTPEDVVCIGDSDHDRVCAAEAGVDFALAGWNPRAAIKEGDMVLTDPMQVLELLT